MYSDSIEAPTAEYLSLWGKGAVEEYLTIMAEIQTWCHRFMGLMRSSGEVAGTGQSFAAVAGGPLLLNIHYIMLYLSADQSQPALLCLFIA